MAGRNARPWVLWVHDVPGDFQAIKLYCSLTCLIVYCDYKHPDISFIVSHRKKNKIVHNSLATHFNLSNFE